ncbi:hypothetical protein TNIN_348741, partial [Trichonephila inaurata madagascariensis]
VWANCTDIPTLFLPKKVTFSKIEGTRRRGRPPTRWLDVEKDLKLMGISRCKADMTDRINWKKIRESALTCKRPLSL